MFEVGFGQCASIEVQPAQRHLLVEEGAAPENGRHDLSGIDDMLLA